HHLLSIFIDPPPPALTPFPSPPLSHSPRRARPSAHTAPPMPPATGPRTRLTWAASSATPRSPALGSQITAPRIAKQKNTTGPTTDRKSTRLNSRHLGSSYAVLCLKKKH